MLCLLLTGSLAVGAMVDAGVPSGAGASLVYRPSPYLRLHAGGAHNGIAPGVQAGVTLALLRGFLSPTLTVEGGRFFSGDDRALAHLAGATSADAPEQLGYDYGNAHVGLEVGPSWAKFYLHAGVSRVRAAWSREVASTMSRGTIDGLGFSARAGFLFYVGG